jgi:ElaB/YqjD/DUF883 family membrane-anchored ribosome-binding protein
MANAQIIPIDKNGARKNEAEVLEQRLPAEEEIRRTRQEIAATTTQIQRQIRSSLDWKRWVDRHPLATVTLAVATGFVVGSALPSLSGTQSVRSEGKTQEGLQPEQELIDATSKNTVVATVLTNVAMNVLREGSSYLVRKFFTEKS